MLQSKVRVASRHLGTLIVSKTVERAKLIGRSRLPIALIGPMTEDCICRDLTVYTYISEVHIYRTLCALVHILLLRLRRQTRVRDFRNVER